MCLGLAHQVSAHVSGLGIDTAAHTVEHCHHGAAQGIAREGHGEGDEMQAQQIHIAGRGLLQLGQTKAEDHIHDEQAQQSKSAHTQAHDAAALEGYLHGLADVPGLTGSVGHAHIGVGGDLHAHEAGAGRHSGADDQSDGGVPGGDNGHNHRYDGHHDEKHLVLISYKSTGAHTDSRCNFTHFFRSLRHFLHTQEVEQGKSQGQYSGKNDQ